jgi:2-polyprenyl-3-methyl-5-hydroxy-6-metoxy-1,4-benzoquinol methylase
VSDRFDAEAATWDEDPARAARAAEVARQIMERVRPTTRMDVLDFGSGTGLLGFQLLPHVASVTFADTSEGMLREVEAKLGRSPHRGGRTLPLDPDALALPRSYDAVVSLMTLHHVGDPVAVLRLLAAHIAPGGWLAVCDLDTEDGTFHEDLEGDVHHGFDRATLIDLMEELGFLEVEAATAYVMRLQRSAGERAYPLFLLTARKPA